MGLVVDGEDGGRRMRRPYAPGGSDVRAFFAVGVAY
jgi:hypothetical protein